MPAARRRRRFIDEDGRLNLTLFGISDMELLAVVDDLADEDGWVATLDVRLQLGENVENERKSGVGPRLAWMKRYGWLERDPDAKHNETRWRLTAIGQTLLENPKISAQFERAFRQLNPAQRLILTRELGEATNRGAEEIRNAIRRQWTRSLGGAR